MKKLFLFIPLLFVFGCGFKFVENKFDKKRAWNKRKMPQEMQENIEERIKDYHEEQRKILLR